MAEVLSIGRDCDGTTGAPDGATGRRDQTGKAFTHIEVGQ
jgi:hypothetical protein